MNVTDLITDRMHENLKPRDINEFEKYRWLVEMIAIEYAQEQVKKCSIPDVSNCECKNLPEGEIAISSKALTDPNWKS